MRVLNFVLIGFVLLTLFAIGMQCEDSESRQEKLMRKQERRLRELQGQRTGQSPNQRARRRHRLRTTAAPSEDTDLFSEAPRRLTGRKHSLHRPSRPRAPAQPSLFEETQNDGYDPSSIASELITTDEEGNDLYNDTSNTNNSDPESMLAEGVDLQNPLDQDNSNLTLTPEPTISQESWANRQRDKAFRLLSFQLELLRRLGMTEFPHVSPMGIFNGNETENLPGVFLQNQITEEEEPYVQKDHRTDFQNHLPSCKVPRKCDKALWNDESKFRLFFTMEKDKKPPTNNVTSAILKLYKRPLEDCNCRGNAAQSRNGRRRSARDRPNRRSRRDGSSSPEEEDVQVEETRPKEEESKIVVKVLQYTKPIKLRKNDKVGKVKVHTKPVVTKRVPASFEGWVNFNILPAVKHWKKKPHQNYGITVEATLNKAPLEATRVFDSFNCSASNVTALPNPFRLTVAIFEKSDSNSDSDRDSDTIVYNINQTYPNLGVVTVYSMQVRRQSLLRRKRAAVGTQTLRCVRQRRMLPVADIIKDIISPPQVDAGRCVVRGPGNMRITHALCAPSQYRPLNILYVDGQGAVVSGTLDGIIVDRCAFQTTICSTQPNLCQ